ncbi:hypothetical protein [Selenomonas sp. AB3002]|uniref:hypothetical protein n=1 Tax=Selenomonas sp. AB3002 TaxID=1392502 RepID=UPI0004979C11
MAVSRQEVKELSNKDLLRQFQSITITSIFECNTRRGLTKSTARAEGIITRELCERLGVEYYPEDWKY